MQVFSIDANTGALTAVGSAVLVPGATVLTFVQ
jgi:6-phosphogluconolactonase (cycloisomerase 2 family)